MRSVMSLAAFTVASMALAHGVYAQVPNYQYQWATITSPGNAPYVGPTGDGSPFSPVGQVDYMYRIAKTEVSTADWLEFANTMAALGEDYRIGEGPTGAYHIAGAFPNGHVRFELSNLPNAGRLPVQGITWRNAARYCNWLHNGKANSLSALQTGAYDTNTFGQFFDPIGGGIRFTDALTHLPGAKFWIPTVDEWIKAAHFDPHRYGPNQPGYWNYSTSSDTAPIIGPESTGGQTNAGYTNYSDINTFLIGAHPGTTSPWGLLDVSGGSSEWQEDAINTSERFERFYDGSYTPFQFNPASDPLRLDLIYSRGGLPANLESTDIGLRLASAVPSPSVSLSILAGGSLGLMRRRRPSALPIED